MSGLGMTPEQWQVARKQLKLIGLRFGTSAALNFGHKKLQNHVRARAAEQNRSSTNRSLANAVHRVARDRYGVNPNIVRSNNPLTRTTGPVYIPKENAIVGPSGHIRRRSAALATLDDPAVLAHELGHAMSNKRTPWIQKHAPKVRTVANIGSALGMMEQSPTLVALMSAAAEAPTILEERMANRNAKNLLLRTTSRRHTQHLLRPNHAIERVGLAKALANILSSTAFVYFGRRGRKALSSLK